MDTSKRGFGSDNNAGMHPRVLAAIAQVNTGHVEAYGHDSYTQAAIEKIQSLFRKKVEVFFTFNGTGANVLALQTMVRSHQAILCSENAHIHHDECGAPEKFTGAKLITMPSKNGKLDVAILARHLDGVGNEHHVQPRAISLAQTTELGTVYQVEELLEITEFAHKHGLLVYVDGARMANAVAALGTSLSEMIEGTGVDAFSLGGTKNGLMLGEAVVILNASLAQDFLYLRKQGMQLASKMRFISAQFTAILSDDLWLKNASHSNAMATLLATELKNISTIKISRPVEANAVFAVLPADLIARLQARHFFYVWDEDTSEVRWMTAFDTTPDDIMNFVQSIRELSI